MANKRRRSRSPKAPRRKGRQSTNLPDGGSTAARRTVWVGCLIVVGLVVAVYARSFGFELTRSDDVTLVVDDAAFLSDSANITQAFGRRFLDRGPAGEGYYRPLITLSLMWDAAIGKTDPMRALIKRTVGFEIA